MEKGEDGARAKERLGKEFRTPGHIPVCRESPGGLKTRQGHTELAVSIARLAGLTACTIGAEMLEPDGDGALSLEGARAYANKARDSNDNRRADFSNFQRKRLGEASEEDG